MMKTNNDTKIIFSISEDDVQTEAMERIGRRLTEEEMFIAAKGLEWGMLTGIHIIYKTILTEMIIGQ